MVHGGAVGVKAFGHKLDSDLAWRLIMLKCPLWFPNLKNCCCNVFAVIDWILWTIHKLLLLSSLKFTLTMQSGLRDFQLLQGWVIGEKDVEKVL